MLQDTVVAPTASEPQVRDLPSKSGAFIGLAIVTAGGLGTLAWSGFLLWMLAKAVLWLLA
jgi:hypothetical protein